MNQLYNCWSCGKEMGKSADRCPHCRNPNYRANAILFVWIVVGAMIVYTLYTASN